MSAKKQEKASTFKPAINLKENKHVDETWRFCRNIRNFDENIVPFAVKAQDVVHQLGMACEGMISINFAIHSVKTFESNVENSIKQLRALKNRIKKCSQIAAPELIDRQSVTQPPTEK